MHRQTLAFPIQNKHHLCWGADGLYYYAAHYSAIVVVDILSFCTTVDIAISRGGSIIPTSLNDEVLLQSFADQHNAILARKRNEPGITLSPASIQSLQPGQTVLLPSLNGSTLMALASKLAKPVFAGCFRNSQYLAELLEQEKYFPVLFVAAGERFPNNTLRPSIEDYWGVGSILSSLNGQKTIEAECAVTAFKASADDLTKNLIICESGQELIAGGYAQDVALAAEYNSSNQLPTLTNRKGQIQLSNFQRNL
ncbi:MAG: 2-phosphosulfolactate phosphatase [Chlamydiales bacterium]|nr:2-phosphosulfolactate phosphatase [Chlamydiales bacterium]